MPDQIGRTVKAAALEAHDAGLCVVRAATDGTKKPLGQWKQYQQQRPDREQVETWFGGGHPGMGIICGAVSGNFEMLELEGRAVEAGIIEELKVEADRRGIRHLLNKVALGCRESTPSGGVHFNYRVSGAVGGNTKLARTDTGEALIETRGEGGFTITAPSNGATHPSGRPWTLAAGDFTTIPTITPAERDQLWELCRAFDRYTEPTATPPPPKVEHDPFMAASGPSWMDAVVDEFNRSHTWGEILVGWTEAFTQGDVTYWTRPGKEVREGTSATTNAKGTDRLIVFSSSVAGFDTYTGVGSAPSYDRFGAWAVLNFGGDRVAAGRTMRPQKPPGAPYVDPGTGEIIRAWPCLPEAFWTSRASLEHIRQAAHSRARSADAVLVFVLARVSLLIHPKIHLPPIVGARASLNPYGAIVGPSGVGKSSAKEVAAELVPISLVDVADDLALGSGEGIIEAFFDLREEASPTGKGVRMVKYQAKSGVMMYLDEGQALAELGGRKGSTLLPTLRSAWTGATLGQANASAETKRRLPAHSYRLAFVAGFQPGTAQALLDDAEGGTPQRFEWAAATDPNIPDDLPAWPGPFDLEPFPVSDFGTNEIRVAPAVAEEIQKRSLRRTRGEEYADTLEGHGDLARMKVAALLAALEGRLEINQDDWQLAGIVRETTGKVRDRVMAYAQDKAQMVEQAATQRLVRREGELDRAKEYRALEAMAKAVARRAARDGGVLTRSDLLKAAKGKDRQTASFDDAIDIALQKGWLRKTDEGYAQGGSTPWSNI
jgi:hypothetical protein